MGLSKTFFRLVLDSLTEHIVVIDAAGNIEYVNKAWSEFGHNNACTVNDNWIGINYIEECDKAAATGDEFGIQAGNGIRSLIAGKEALFYFEYPCHSPLEARWFMMRVSRLDVENHRYFVICHQDITERKLAENSALSQSRIDGLTNIPNRRHFDRVLNNELQRCSRLKKPLSLAIIDIDHFKLLNDNYGHQYGDDCLIQVAKSLKEVSCRPSDFHARYGGEEFAIIWGDTNMSDARILANKLLNIIANLNLENIKSPTEKYLTVSIGIASLIPNTENTKAAIIKQADNMLYKAKDNGRNRIKS